MQEILQNLFVGNIREGYLIQAVGVHKLVEDVSTENNCLWYEHLHLFIFIQVRPTFDDIIQKGKTASFAAKRTLTDAGKLTVGVVTVAMENSYHALIFHTAIGYYGIEDVLTMSIYITDFIPCDFLQKFRNREKGT